MLRISLKGRFYRTPPCNPFVSEWFQNWDLVHLDKDKMKASVWKWKKIWILIPVTYNIFQTFVMIPFLKDYQSETFFDWRKSQNFFDRETDKQTDRQTGRQAGRQADRQIDRPKDRQADRQTDRQIKTQWHKGRDRGWDKDTDRHGERHRWRRIER